MKLSGIQADTLTLYSFIVRKLLILVQQVNVGVQKPVVQIGDFVRKLDVDFYAARWSRVTDRQRELLVVIAQLPTANDEFTAKEISEKSSELLDNPFAPAYVINSLNKLIGQGLIFKNRRGKYSFAVPLLANYINRSIKDDALDYDL